MKRHQAVAGVSLVNLGDGQLLQEVQRRHARRVARQLAEVAAAARRVRENADVTAFPVVPA